jgi:hypothetical protein
MGASTETHKIRTTHIDLLNRRRSPAFAAEYVADGFEFGLSDGRSERVVRGVSSGF